MAGPILVPSPGAVQGIPGWPTGVPGLVVAEIPAESASCAGAWSVLHARSGLRLLYCLPDPEAALGLALAVAGVTDWRQPGQEVRAGMRARCYDIAVGPYQSWKCRHGQIPRLVTQDNGVIA